MRITAAVLALALCVPAFADAVEEVRQAETGFAKAFADRDKAKFFSYVADDAVFISALGTQRGKTQVVDRWSRFFDGMAEAPFSWGPERVEITSGGTVGFSMGPIYGADGKHGGYYSSIWHKQQDGAWKVVFDGPGNPGAPLRETAAPFEEGFIDAEGGAKLYYRKVGQGPVTIIAPLDFVLHDEMKQLADIATVITYDLRSRGKSSKIDDLSLRTVEQDVRDLETVRAKFNIEKFVPVGYSYLGKVVVMYAAAHPDRVRRVVQIGPVGNVPKIVSNQMSLKELGVPEADSTRFSELRAAGALEKSPKEFCEAQWKVIRYNFVVNPKNASRIDGPGCNYENEWPVNFNRAMAVLWPTAMKPMSDADLKRVSMPVLTIHGTQDRNAPYEGGREWVQALPDARLVTVERAAHAAWADDPVAVFGAIRHFLRGEWPLGSKKV
jgi:pimeloyl-ACP methyl ester carboxylesterase/ketosteroid isomerase-like protein